MLNTQCDIELQKKLNVVKVKYCDRIKTVLLDFSVPLGEWVPLVRKKFDQEDNNELRVYMSGESQRTPFLFFSIRIPFEKLLHCLARCSARYQETTI